MQEPLAGKALALVGFFHHNRYAAKAWCAARLHKPNVRPARSLFKNNVATLAATCRFCRLRAALPKVAAAVRAGAARADAQTASRLSGQVLGHPPTAKQGNVNIMMSPCGYFSAQAFAPTSMPTTQNQPLSGAATSPPLPPSAAAELSLQRPAAQLAPAQLRFDQLLEKVVSLTQKLAQIQALADTFGPQYRCTLPPLQAKYNAVWRAMLLQLDVRLQTNELSPALLRKAKALVCGCSESLAVSGDQAMRALHDRHSPQTLSDKEKAAADDKKNMRPRRSGVQVSSTSDFNSLDSCGSVHDLQRSKPQTLDQQTGKAAARRHSKPKSAAQQQACALQHDAQGVLRSLYRRLASALHPDREPDALARVRKTDLMGQANAAYARRDLLALLTLQRRCDAVDAGAVCRLTAEKMAALSLLLQQRVTALDGGLRAAAVSLQAEFSLSQFTPLTAAGLALELNAQALGLMAATAEMQDDLRCVQTGAGLKRWLKAQTKMAKASGFGLAFDGTGPRRFTADD